MHKERREKVLSRVFKQTCVSKFLHILLLLQNKEIKQASTRNSLNKSIQAQYVYSW